MRLVRLVRAKVSHSFQHQRIISNFSFSKPSNPFNFIPKTIISFEIVNQSQLFSQLVPLKIRVHSSHTIMYVIRNFIQSVNTKEPTIQTLIGAGCGFAAALYSVQIAKSAALLIGVALLLLSTLTDIALNPDFLNLTFKTDKIVAVCQHNTYLSVGFFSGFLIGFSVS